MTATLQHRYEKGDTVSARAFTEVSQAASLLMNARGGRNMLVQHTPGGVAVLNAGHTVDQFMEPCVWAWAKNVSASTVNALDVVQLTDPPLLHGDTSKWGTPVTAAYIYGDRTLEVTPVVTAAFGRFGVAFQQLAADEVGMVAVGGVALCRIVLTEPGQTNSLHWNWLRKNDRADTLADSPNLVLCQAGAAEVLWYDWTDLDRSVHPLDPRLCIIRFGTRRTAGITICQQGNEANYGTAEVLEFDGVSQVYFGHPGIAQVNP